MPILLVLHVVPAAFWFGATGVISSLGAEAARLPLRRPQGAAAIVAMIVGAALWLAAGHALAGPGEILLATGALAALAAFALQQGVAWPSAKRAGDGLNGFAAAQRASAVLLILALVAMIVAPHV